LYKDFEYVAISCLFQGFVHNISFILKVGNFGHHFQVISFILLYLSVGTFICWSWKLWASVSN